VNSSTTSSSLRFCCFASTAFCPLLLAFSPARTDILLVLLPSSCWPLSIEGRQEQVFLFCLPSKWPANGLSTVPAVFFLFDFHFYVDWYLFSTRKLAKSGQKETWAMVASVVLTLWHGMGAWIWGSVSGPAVP